MKPERRKPVATVKTRDRVYFQAHRPAPIDEREARRLQVEAGYMPEGYGFDSFRAWPDGSGWTASWSCSSSCD